MGLALLRRSFVGLNIRDLKTMTSLMANECVFQTDIRVERQLNPTVIWLGARCCAAHLSD